MSSVTLELDTKDWDRFLSAISSKMNMATDKLLALSKVYGFQDIIKHFAEEQGPDSPWKKRAESTQERYRRIGAGELSPPKGTPRAAYNPTNKLLQLTGTLRQSVSPASGRGQKRGRGVVELFTNVEYASIHEMGEGHIPARPFMWMSDDAIEKVADGLILWTIEEGMN